MIIEINMSGRELSTLLILLQKWKYSESESCKKESYTYSSAAAAKDSNVKA
nr:MAG TPA: hypothetical protein [Caudoviricetes sp.]